MDLMNFSGSAEEMAKMIRESNAETGSAEATAQRVAAAQGDAPAECTDPGASNQEPCESTS